MANIHVFLDNVSKRFGKFEAVKNLTLHVEEGSFVTLLGPSGCGKTTTLRMLAGFYDPDEGEIYFHGIPQQGIPPEKRETSIVFQEYALFPHMNVFENVSYGLRIRHINKKEVQMRTEETLEQVDLKGRGSAPGVAGPPMTSPGDLLRDDALERHWVSSLSVPRSSPAECVA